MLALEILKLLNTLGPAAIELILITRDPTSGKVSVVSITESTDEQAQVNLDQLKVFFNNEQS